MKSILITGAFGQLGLACSSALQTKFRLIKTGLNVNSVTNKLDISSKKSVESFLGQHSPDIILNLAAMTDVDGCERDPEGANRVNFEGVVNLCEGFKGHFIQLSTDYVFNGLKGPYLEEHPTDAICVYGQSKLDAEKFLINSKINHTIIRANVLYSYSPDTKASFLKWVVESLKDSKSINVVRDQWNNPTWTYSITEIINLLIEHEQYGLFHYADKDILNRFQFAQLIAKVFELNDSMISPISTDVLNQQAPRPMKSGLLTKKIESVLEIEPKSVETCLNKIRKQLLK